MAPVPAKIVSLMDISDSMRQFGYITPAKADLDTFINMFQPGDQFAIISFSDSIYRTFPATATLATYTDPSVLAQASAAVQALRTVNMTNIGDAIIAGSQLLQPQREPRGMVLLSDGIWNRGPDPLKVLPKDIRIYTIALGNNGQLDLLRTIARNTQGQYLFTPDAIGLASIYFDILEFAQVGQVVTNSFRAIHNAQRLPALVKLSAGLPSASVAVNWADPSIRFATGGTAPETVQVRILDPDFKPVTLQPVYRDYGFVVYTLLNPKAGDWSFDTFYHGAKTCNVTAGAIDPDMLTRLHLEAPQVPVAAGETFTVRARVTHDGRPHAHTSLAAAVDAPAVSVDDAIREHGAALAAIELPANVDPQAPQAQLARLTALRQQRLPAVDILPRHTLAARSRELAAGEFETFVHAPVPGEYTLRVEAVGEHPNGGEFMRTRLLTVSVH